MHPKNIISFARTELEQHDRCYDGRGYRCAAILTDGTYLPCIRLENPDLMIGVAERTLEERRADMSRPKSERRFYRGADYHYYLRWYITDGNRLNYGEIERLERSRFAIPRELLKMTRETGRDYTLFAGVMHDGREFVFHTSFAMDFFEMPEGYAGSDIVRVIPHKDGKPIYNPRKIVFHCYINGL